MSALQNWFCEEQPQVRPPLLSKHQMDTRLSVKQPSRKREAPLLSLTGFEQLQAWYVDGAKDSAHAQVLNETYVIEDHAIVNRFIEENRLENLLLQAKDHLDTVFGKSPLKKLSLVTDDEGFATLFCLVMWPKETEKAREALSAFDRQWWLARSRKVSGKLNFDFELV